LVSGNRLESGGDVEGAVDQFDEVSFFAQDETFCLRCGEVFAAFRIRFQACAACLVGSQAVESSQAPRDVIRSFMWQKIADEMPAASGNDAAPILGTF
jgi:ribosomal protein L37E